MGGGTHTHDFYCSCDASAKWLSPHFFLIVGSLDASVSVVTVVIRACACAFLDVAVVHCLLQKKKLLLG
jgi:hypothetical protein